MNVYVFWRSVALDGDSIHILICTVLLYSILYISYILDMEVFLPGALDSFGHQSQLGLCAPVNLVI